MWNNIGVKVQRLAKVFCWLGVILSILMGLLVILNSGSMMVRVNGQIVRMAGSGMNAVNWITGILIMLIGSLFSWIASWVTYAIGEAAEAAEIAKAKRGEGNE